MWDFDLGRFVSFCPVSFASVVLITIHLQPLTMHVQLVMSVTITLLRVISFVYSDCQMDRNIHIYKYIYTRMLGPPKAGLKVD